MNAIAVTPALQGRAKGRPKTIKPMLTFAEVVELLQRQAMFSEHFIRPIGATQRDFEQAMSGLIRKEA